MEKDKQVMPFEGEQALVRVNVQMGLVDKVLEEVNFNTKVIFTNSQIIDITYMTDSLIFQILEGKFKRYNKENDIINTSKYGTKNNVYTPDYIVTESLKENSFKILRTILKENISRANIATNRKSPTFLRYMEHFDWVFNEYIKSTKLPFKNIGRLDIDDNGQIIQTENIEGTSNKDMDKTLKAIISSLCVPNRTFTKGEYLQSKTDQKFRRKLYKDVKLLNLPQRVNFLDTVNKLYSLIQGINSYEEMIKELEENAPTNSEFWELLDKLPTTTDLQKCSFKTIHIVSKFVSFFGNL